MAPSAPTDFSLTTRITHALVKRLILEDDTTAPVHNNYIHESNKPKLLAIASVFITVATISVFLRMYCRAVLIKSTHWDDYAICVALMFAWVDFGCFVGKGSHGMGRHKSTQTPAHSIVYTHIGFFQSQAFVLCTFCIRTSVALLLMRLTPQVWWRRFLWGLIIFLGCFTTACLGTLIFQCWPVNAAWNPKVKATGHCYSRKSFASIGLFNTCINIISDIILASIPIPIVWNLQMNRNSKVAIVGILSMGYFATVCGIIKGVKQVNWIKLKDTTFNEEIHCWDAIAVGIAIAAACAPTLKPLFRTILGLGSSRGGSATGGPSKTGYQRRSKGTDVYGDNSTKKSNHSFLSKYAGKGFEMNTQIMGTKMDSEEELAAQYAATVSPGGTIRKTPIGDNDDEEMMVEKRKPKIGVTRTVEVTVTSQARDGDSM